MQPTDNIRIVKDIFAELSKGNSKPFFDHVADDVRWTTTGTTAWSKTFHGKQSVLDDLLRPLRTQWASQYTVTAKRIIAGDDYVVVEARGSVTTKAGKPYNNEYCFIYKMAGGKIMEITEYLDTALVNETLTP
jgi:ketosteroid isomerase-like protein